MWGNHRDTQVIPALHEEAPEQEDPDLAEDKPVLEVLRQSSPLGALLGAHSPEGKFASLKAARKRKTVEHQASYQLLRAIDHAMSLCGVGLSTFMGGSGSRPLAESEMRYFVRDPTNAEVPFKRACIKNLSFGGKRFEIDHRLLDVVPLCCGPGGAEQSKTPEEHPRAR